MERSTTASACFNNLLCIWDEMLPPLESTTSWHMIQTSRISKNLRCLWNSNEKLKSSLGWHPMPNSVLVPLFWKLRNLEGTVLALRTEALWNPLWQSLALGDCMECTSLSVQVSQRSVMPQAAGRLLLRKATSYGKAHHEHRTSLISWREVVGLSWFCFVT